MPDDKQDSTKDSLRKGLNEEDLDLWKEMTRDVKLLDGKTYQAPSGISSHRSKNAINPVQQSKPQKHQNSKVGALPHSHDLDHQTLKRLKRGNIPIEGKIDLHGMNQPQARKKLIEFILHAHNTKKRCVLVITGKGNTGRVSNNWLDQKPGILKRKVPDWLYEAELNSIVLKAVQAQPKDGGSGALYVYLRRMR